MATSLPSSNTTPTNDMNELRLRSEMVSNYSSSHRQRRQHSAPPPQGVTAADKDWKRVVKELRKDGIVTTMGIKQALSKGALSITTHEKCPSSGHSSDSDSSKAREKLDKQQMYRRLEAVSIERAVHKLVREDAESLNLLTRKSIGSETDVASAGSNGRFSRNNSLNHNKPHHHSQRVGLVKESDIQMDSNIYKLESPVKKQNSRGRLMQKLEKAFHLSSLASELDPENP